MNTEAQAAAQEHKFVISRLLDAPRDLVWKAWTEKEHMQWWGPKGVTIDRVTLDFRPGGLFHYCMRTPDGHEMWGRWIVNEIVPPERFVFVNSFSNEAGGITRHPGSAHWPLEMLSTITFEERGGQTLLTIQWEPLRAEELEIKTFDESHESMRNGWGGTLDQLAAYLAKH